ncbi:YceI-like domain-containing protein [Lutibacter oricola]|uniref:YceI-like domain-containing protein n=1 Tax=Lutibacter oricola TaxID=762486 RepID=A0A1H2TT55_9FLAO|nr:YceI family protein [Lutibacter oricola]SDW46918.1 YceI-like domain-containing protein [Lutibacter oricola]
MKKIVLLTLVLSMSLLACKTEKKEPKPTVVENKTQVAVVENGVYIANVDASVLKWKGFKPTESHDGEFKLKEGSFEVKEGNLIAGKFTLDMGSITVSDIPADDKFNAKLVGHLKNEDFFNVEKFPVATFVITSVEGSLVKGNLTIKDITKPVAFETKLAKTASGVEFIAEPFKIDRTEFDIQYKSKKFFENLADKFIKDKFEISFKVQASK